MLVTHYHLPEPHASLKPKFKTKGVLKQNSDSYGCNNNSPSPYTFDTYKQMHRLHLFFNKFTFYLFRANSATLRDFYSARLKTY